MQQKRQLHWGDLWKRTLSGALSAAMLLSGMVVTSEAAGDDDTRLGGGAPDILTYAVAEGFDYDDTDTFCDSEEAWEYADQIVTHVESAAAQMREIFKKQTVTITDEKYGAEASEDYENAAATKETERDLAIRNTKAIYAAIKDVSEAGGGTVLVPAMDGEVFYTSALHLEDNVNLCVEEGAVLKFTTDTDLYCGDLMEELYYDPSDPNCGVDENGLTLTRFESVELMNYSPFIYAYGKRNIALTGEGTIDGQASNGKQGVPEWYWHQWKSTYTYTTDNGTVKKQAQAAPRTQLFAQGQVDVPVAKRQYGESESEEWSGASDGFLRPNFVQPYNCQNVLIEDINITGSPMWELNPVLCDTVLVDGVYVESHMSNNDGCDPEASSNVVIQNSIFDVGDDCVAIKSGRNGDGIRVNRLSFNIVIQKNTMKDGHGGVTIGSEITAGVKNIFSRDNAMESTQLQCAYRFKTNYIRGGTIENIYYKNDDVFMVQSSKPVILVDLNYDIKSEVTAMKQVGTILGLEDFSYQAYMPSFNHVVFEEMTVNEAEADKSGGKYAFQLNGFSVDSIDSSCDSSKMEEDCYITGFTVKDSTFVGSTQAFNMNYVDGLTLDHVTISGSTTADAVSNCKNLTFIDCDFHDSVVQRSTFEEIAEITNTRFAGEEEFTGAVKITGEAKPGETLTADVSDVEPEEVQENLSYEWTCGGETVGKEKTYTVKDEDAGKTITLTVTAEGYGSELTDSIEIAAESDLSEVEFDAADMKISGLTAGMEYSLDGGETWIPVADEETIDLSVSDVNAADGIQLRQSGSDSVTEIKLTQASKPVVTIDEEGNVSGLSGSKKYEYREDYSDEWQTLDDSVELSVGMEIRVAGEGTMLASEAATITEKSSGGDEPGTVKVTGVTLDTHSAKLYTNRGSDTLQLTATVEPTDAENKDVIWTSSDDSIATVDENGLVTIHSIGSATITAITADGGYQDSCVVNVKKYTSSSSSSSSSSSTSSTYKLTVEDADNGSVKTDVSKAEEGDTVTITVKPDSGYVLDELVITDKNGKEIDYKDKGDGKYTFKMPDSKVTIEAAFAPEKAEDKTIILTIGLTAATVFGRPVINDVAPIARNNRTMLPIRFVAEALGAQVDWDAAAQKVTITRNTLLIEIYLNSDVAYVNGQPVQLDSPAFAENNRTYLPLRFVAENLGAVVGWDASTQTVTIIAA